jgi:hypothetical protein
MRGPKRAKGNPTRKPDDKAQFERFFETIRKSGVEEGGPALDGEPKDIVPQKTSREALVGRVSEIAPSPACGRGLE